MRLGSNIESTVATDGFYIPSNVGKPLKDCPASTIGSEIAVGERLAVLNLYPVGATLGVSPLQHLAASSRQPTLRFAGRLPHQQEKRYGNVETEHVVCSQSPFE